MASIVQDLGHINSKQTRKSVGPRSRCWRNIQIFDPWGPLQIHLHRIEGSLLDVAKLNQYMEMAKAVFGS